MIAPYISKSLFLCLSIFFCLPVLAQPSTLDKIAMSLRPDLIVEDEPLWSLSERMENYKVPGVSIAVVKDFKLIGTQSYGKVQAGLPAKPTTETAFQAASISKLVNAVGIMKLVEAGKLDLDQGINKILTTWKLPTAEQYGKIIKDTMYRKTNRIILLT